MEWTKASHTSFPVKEGWYVVIVRNEKEEFMPLTLYYSQSWHVPYHIDILFFTAIENAPVEFKRQKLY